MAMQTHFFFLFLAIALVGSYLFPVVVVATQGTATFYKPPYVPSACNGFKHDGVMIAAASDVFWHKGAACGSKYKVTCTGATNNGDRHPCTGKSVVVKIVDYCPSCGGTIDLSKEAFVSIAHPGAGKIKIEYNRV